jgi:protein-disulfide isomerase
MSNPLLKLSLSALAVLLGCAAQAQTPSPLTANAADAQATSGVMNVTEPPGMPAAADPQKVVGEIKGTPVSLGELTRTVAERLAQQRATYQLRRQQLDYEYQRAQQQVLEEGLGRLLSQRAISLEAAARKTDPLSLIGTVPDVTDEQLRAHYESRKTADSPPFEKITPDTRRNLQQELTASTMEAYYAGLRAKYQAMTLLEPLREPVKADGPAKGPADAPIAIVEFGDFQCPFCRRMEPTLRALMQRYPQQIRLVYRNYPLTEIHSEALPAAQAAVCAGRQGKFWEMHDAIYSDSAPLSIESLRSMAARIGLDKTAFEECVRSDEANVAIQADRAAGDALGVLATPTLFINGRLVQGGVAEDKLVAIIDDELKRLTPARAETAER